MSALTLAALGWVEAGWTKIGWGTDHPRGNRLRWSWPEDIDGKHVLPKALVIERAPLDATIDPAVIASLGPAAAVIDDAWDQLGDRPLFGFMPGVVTFVAPVQAVAFTYEPTMPGDEALLQAFAGADCVVTQWLHDGDPVVLQAAAIDRITVMSPACMLRALATLDLYKQTSLPFEAIATIEVGKTAGASYAQVSSRYPATPTMTSTQWDELRDLWGTAWGEAPGAVGQDGGPTAWHALQIVLATRWEHAVLCGLGFVDGPDNGQPSIDSWSDLLKSPPATVVAYRVIDPGGKLDPSNVVYLPGGEAVALAGLANAPSIDGTVRLGSSGAIRAWWDLSWASSDPAVVGVEIEETLTVDGSPSTMGYLGRGRRDTDPPGAGFIPREEDVQSADVDVSARARPQDGFDRLGPWSSWSPAVTLALDHHPQPPPLRSATNDGTTTILEQSLGDWAPDAIVADAKGEVLIWRRTDDPARFSAPVLEAIPDGGVLALTLGVSAPSDPGAFIGGQASVGTTHGTVFAISWPLVVLDVQHGDGPIPTVAPGSTVELSQSPSDTSLYTQVHHESTKGLKPSIQFADATGTPQTAQLIEYRAQLTFAGQFGPMGPAVQALRLPPTPPVPPPFKVATLGVDFYHRTVVQLDLTKPSGDLLEVWWTVGDLTGDAFVRASVPGEAGPRFAENGKILFDILSLPVPNKVPRTVTIGVQSVNAADGRSSFKALVVTLPAA